jgi:cholesterol 7alpha-monooxygenase
MGNSGEPFAITIMGTKYYVLTTPTQASSVYGDPLTFSWDNFLNDALMGFGVHRDRLNVLWQRTATPTAVNPAQRCLIHLTQELYKQFLLPGPAFAGLINTYQGALRQMTSWDRISGSYGLATPTETWRVSLYDLCANIMIDATQLSLFDPILFTIEPSMTQGMRAFTDELWKLMNPSPFIDSRRILSIRTRYRDAFLQYQRLPKEKRSKEAALVTKLIDQYHELDINAEDSAAMLIMVYWA